MKQDFIFECKDKEIQEMIHDLGSEYSKIIIENDKAKLVSNKFGKLKKETSLSLVYFLRDINFLTEEMVLSEYGKNYFKNKYILKEEQRCIKMLHDGIIKNSVVSLILQVFYGRGEISKIQLCELLNFNNVANKVLNEKDMSSLLMLLNKYKIITYHRKKGTFVVNEFTNEVLSKQYYIEPSIPYSNISNMRKIIRNCKGNIYWIDKHFRKEGFEILADGLNKEGVERITVISGNANITESAKNDYSLLKKELHNRNITLEWKYINDNNFKFHDRWLIADNIKYNIPPILAIIRGQRSELLETKCNVDVETFLDNAIDVAI